MASAAIIPGVKSTGKGFKMTEKASRPEQSPDRRATYTNIQYAVQGVPGTWALTRKNSAGGQTTVMSSVGYGNAGTGVLMNVDTSDLETTYTADSGSVGPCVDTGTSAATQAANANTFVGTTFYTQDGTAPSACSDLLQITVGDYLTTPSNAEITLAYGLMRSSVTPLGTYIRQSGTDNIWSLKSTIGETQGSSVSSIETPYCDYVPAITFQMITILSTVTLDTVNDWDSAASQSLYPTIEFSLDCNTIPQFGIIGIEGTTGSTAVDITCSGCASFATYTSNPATKVQVSIVSILLLGLLMMIIG
jgi:hypothetical protein